MCEGAASRTLRVTRRWWEWKCAVERGLGCCCCCCCQRVACCSERLWRLEKSLGEKLCMEGGKKGAGQVVLIGIRLVGHRSDTRDRARGGSADIQH